jgi:hypothetical protein
MERETKFSTSQRPTFGDNLALARSSKAHGPESPPKSNKPPKDRNPNDGRESTEDGQPYSTPDYLASRIHGFHRLKRYGFWRTFL